MFNQGDEGVSWYVILKGSVNVVIHGKGTVTTLQEGDDFGQLALINNAPRYSKQLAGHIMPNFQLAPQTKGNKYSKRDALASSNNYRSTKIQLRGSARLVMNRAVQQ